MKKSLILVLTLSLLLVTTGSAFAMGKGPQNGRADYFKVTGVINSIGVGSVDVMVVGGNTSAISTPQTIYINEGTTVYLYNNGTTVVPIAFGDLLPGQYVSIQGVISGDTWTAYRITVGASVIHFVP